MQLILAFVLLASVAAFSPVGRSHARSSDVSLEMAAKSRSLPFLPQPSNIEGMVGKLRLRLIFA
jgi:hypothetical protein